MLENDARAVGLPYRVELASGVFEGETDGAGRFRVDTLPADDYLVEIAGQRMHLTSFSRREEARRVMLLDCVVDGSPIESADSEGSGA